MGKRKALSNSVRFEVFKRDSFSCQYCGKSAPDVVLNVDHIVPVAEGGDNNILNLVTSCFDCNSGKGARQLGDHAVVSKQIDQLKLLNERKNQIEMIAKWRSGLADLEDAQLEIIREAIEKHFARVAKTVSDEFLRTELKSALSKYGLDDVLQAIEKSACQYLKDIKSQADRNKFLEMIPRICYWVKHERENPEIAKIRKLAFTANKYWYRCNPQELTRKLLFLNQHENISSDELFVAIRASTGIMKFEENIQELLDQRND